MRKFLFSLASLALVASSFVAVAPQAVAASAVIESAKSRCVIGEQIDGYLGVVSGKSASEGERREMRSVNQRRRAAYERLAARNGVSVADAARATAERLINSAPAGQCVQNASGQWIKK